MVKSRTYTEEIDWLDKIRCEALARQNAALYAVLCQDTGREPEDRDLYNQGLNELNRDFADISKDPILNIRYALKPLELAMLGNDDVRRYRPNLIKKVR